MRSCRDGRRVPQNRVKWRIGHVANPFSPATHFPMPSGFTACGINALEPLLSIITKALAEGDMYVVLRNDC
jgi:hypothetical protein